MPVPSNHRVMGPFSHFISIVVQGAQTNTPTQPIEFRSESTAPCCRRAPLCRRARPQAGAEESVCGLVSPKPGLVLESPKPGLVRQTVADGAKDA